MANFPKRLASPARRALEQAGYTELEQLSNVSDAELLKLHGFGPNALLMLKEELKGVGLSTTEQPQGARSAPTSEEAKTGEVEDDGT